MVCGDTLLACGSFSKNKNWKTLAAAIDEAVEAAMEFNPEYIVIERAWLDLRKDPKTGKYLRDPRNALVSSMKAGLWIKAWYDYGGKKLPVFRVPGKWRKLALGGGAGSRKREPAKAECVMLMGALYKTRFKNDDEADATGLARSATFGQELT